MSHATRLGFVIGTNYLLIRNRVRWAQGTSCTFTKDDGSYAPKFTFPDGSERFCNIDPMSTICKFNASIVEEIAPPVDTLVSPRYFAVRTTSIGPVSDAPFECILFNPKKKGIVIFPTRSLCLKAAKETYPDSDFVIFEEAGTEYAQTVDELRMENDSLIEQLQRLNSQRVSSAEALVEAVADRAVARKRAEDLMDNDRRLAERIARKQAYVASNQQAINERV